MQSGYKPHAEKYAKTLIGIFDCVREKSLAKLLSRIDNVEHPEKIVKDLDYNTTITIKDVNGDTYLIRDNITPFNEDAAYCFDAFVDLVLNIRSMEQKNRIALPDWMNDAAYEKISHIEKGTFPYDFIFSYDNAIYLLSAFGMNANRKLQFHNRTVEKMLESNNKMEVPVFYVFMPVIPKKYSNMDLGDEYLCNTLIARLASAGEDTSFEKHLAVKK